MPCVFQAATPHGADFILFSAANNGPEVPRDSSGEIICACSRKYRHMESRWCCHGDKAIVCLVVQCSTTIYL